MTEPFEGQVFRETPNRVVTRLRSAWATMSLALLPVFYLRLLDHRTLPAVGLGWFAATVAMIPVMRHFARKPRRQPVKVCVDHEGVRVDGKLLIRRQDIASGGVHVAADGGIRV
jgi:hypothetical protein